MQRTPWTMVTCYFSLERLSDACIEIVMQVRAAAVLKLSKLNAVFDDVVNLLNGSCSCLSTSAPVCEVALFRYVKLWSKALSTDWCWAAAIMADRFSLTMASQK